MPIGTDLDPNHWRGLRAASTLSRSQTRNISRATDSIRCFLRSTGNIVGCGLVKTLKSSLPRPVLTAMKERAWPGASIDRCAEILCVKMGRRPRIYKDRSNLDPIGPNCCISDLFHIHGVRVASTSLGEAQTTTVYLQQAMPDMKDTVPSQTIRRPRLWRLLELRRA